MLKINKNSINELFPTEKKGCFELLSNYQPAGDQKRAISELIAGLRYWLECDQNLMYF